MFSGEAITSSPITTAPSQLRTLPALKKNAPAEEVAFHHYSTSHSSTISSVNDDTAVVIKLKAIPYISKMTLSLKIGAPTVKGCRSRQRRQPYLTLDPSYRVYPSGFRLLGLPQSPHLPLPPLCLLLEKPIRRTHVNRPVMRLVTRVGALRTLVPLPRLREPVAAAVPAR